MPAFIYTFGSIKRRTSFRETVCCVAPEDPVYTTKRERTRPPVIFVLGGPGCGKGTQCELLKKHYPVTQLCVGDLLRKETKMDTELGRSVSDIMQRGEIVPGHITMSLLHRQLSLLPSSCAAVLIDGFPRAMDQALEFEKMVTLCEFVVFFKCDPSVMVARLRHRAVTSGRADDTESVFYNRLRTFETKTMPVIEYYRSRGLLREVDAQSGSIQDVFNRTKKLFDYLLLDKAIRR